MKYSIIILTGGQSKRMGTPKEQLIYNGNSILQNMVEVVSLCSDDVIIAGSEGVDSIGIRFISDKRAQQGPLAGLESAMEIAKHDWSLILTSDLIFLHSHLLNWFEKELLHNFDDVRAIISSSHGQSNFLFGFYMNHIHPTIVEHLDSNKLSLKELLEVIKFKELIIPAELENFASNMNSPEDLFNVGLVKIRILGFGQIEDIIGNKEVNWITKARSISELNSELQNLYPSLKNISYSIALNQKITSVDEPLNINDTIALLPPFAGG